VTKTRSSHPRPIGWYPRGGGRGGGRSLPDPAVVVGGRSLHDGADEEGLVAVHLLQAAHDAEAQAARGAAAQNNVLTAVQVPGGGGATTTQSQRATNQPITFKLLLLQKPAVVRDRRRNLASYL